MGSYYNMSDLEDMDLDFDYIRNCVLNAWNKLKRVCIEIGEYDLYSGTKWEDYY